MKLFKIIPHPEWSSFCDWVKNNILDKEIKEVFKCH